MKKKFIPLFATLPLLATSCGQVLPDNKIKICGNIETYLYKKDNHYLTPSLSEISRNIKIGANFVVYFTETGCSSCVEFTPIMDKYLSSSKMAIYKYDLANDEKDINDLKYNYGDIFFNKDDLGQYVVSTPSLALFYEGQAHYVNYDKYMRTELAFNNHMNSTFKEANVYVTTGDVFKNEFDNCEFAYVYFDFANQSLLSLYKSKISQFVYQSSRNVIISNYAEDNHLHLKLCGRTDGHNYSRKEYVVTSETSENIVKEVL